MGAPIVVEESGLAGFGAIAPTYSTLSGYGLGSSIASDLWTNHKVLVLSVGGVVLLGLGVVLYKKGKLPFLHPSPRAAVADLRGAMRLAGLSGGGRRRRRGGPRRRRRAA